MSNKIVQFGDKLFEQFECDFMKAFHETAPSKVTNVGVEWTGGRIPMALWAQIVAFFEYTQRTYQCESQVRLYYNPTTKQWAAWAFPQRISTGLFTQEITDETGEIAERRDRERAQFPASQWEELGTVHHHCTSSAFQSGTDSEDEKNRTGFHITVGHVTSPRYSLHSRFTFKKGKSHVFHQVKYSDFFELPEELASLPAELVDALDLEVLVVNKLRKPNTTASFPEAWKTNLIQRAVGFQGSHGGSQGSVTHYSGKGYYGSGGGNPTIYREDENKIIYLFKEWMKGMASKGTIHLSDVCEVVMAAHSIPRVMSGDVKNACKRYLANDYTETEIAFAGRGTPALVQGASEQQMLGDGLTPEEREELRMWGVQ